MKVMTLRIQLLICGSIIFFACKEGNDGELRFSEKKDGEYIMQGRINKDSAFFGKVTTYRPDHTIADISYYEDGQKNGPSVSFHLTGYKKDSCSYIKGIQSGYYYQYNPIGGLKYVGFSYYGLNVGPQIIYSNGKLSHYYFSDFNKEDLTSIIYDSLGQVSEISFFSMHPGFSKVLEHDVSKTTISFYLPQPPGLSILYRLGKTNDTLKEESPITIRDNVVIVDTILPNVPTGWYYYLSAHVKNSDSSINKVYIEEIKYKD